MVEQGWRVSPVLNSWCDVRPSPPHTHHHYAPLIALPALHPARYIRDPIIPPQPRPVQEVECGIRISCPQAHWTWRESPKGRLLDCLQGKYAKSFIYIKRKHGLIENSDRFLRRNVRPSGGPT